MRRLPGSHIFPLRAAKLSFWRIFRRWPLRVALLIVAFSIFLASCGGSGGNDEPVPTPTATTASTLPDQSPSGNSSTTEPTSGSFSGQFNVSANQWHDLVIDLAAGDLVRVHYKAESRIVGASTRNRGGVENGIVLVVTDPVRDTLFRGDQVEEETVDIVAEVSGEHTFSFVNPFKLQLQAVDVDYTINP